MSWCYDDSFGEYWDLGSTVATDLIAFPLRAHIRNELRAAGINPDNPRRLAASVSASTVGVLMGSILGGPFGLLLGAMGYAVAQAATYPGDAIDADVIEHALALKAAQAATEALSAHVTDDTWNAICDTVHQRAAGLSEDSSWQDAVSAIYYGIDDVDENAAEQWATVFQAAASESGI